MVKFRGFVYMCIYAYAYIIIYINRIFSEPYTNAPMAQKHTRRKCLGMKDV